MHKYSIELKIWGDISDEHDVSARLGLQATTFFKKGEAKSATRKWEASVWSLSFQPSQDQAEWDSLGEGLNRLLDTLMPVKSRVDELKLSYNVAISCADFASGFGGGPTLSAPTLKRLVDLGLDLNFSFYWHDESSVESTSDK